MPPITHTEARRLINFNADQLLDANTHLILDAHLDDCTECRSYARELDEIENILGKIRHRWDLRLAPLHHAKMTNQSKSTGLGFSKGVVMTRMAVALTFVIITAAGIWQFSIRSITSPTASLAAIPIPTPSTYLTFARETTPSCAQMLYQVQINDTLNSIALQFSIPKETIMQLNGMKEEKVNPNMQIRIPVCDHTPTVTTDAPNIIITTSPQFESITQTPA